MQRTARILTLLMLALLLPGSVRAAVTLKYFRVAQVSATAVKLEWETATELDHAMFALSRADAEDGDYQTLETFPAEGDAVSGAYYSFTDTSVAPGRTYWYKLEDLDANGVLNESAAPIAVYVPAEDEPTPTAAPPTSTLAPPTSTSAAIPTPTSLVIQPTAAPGEMTPAATVTPSPEAAASPAPAQPTPTPIRFPTPSGSRPPAADRDNATLLLIIGLASLAGAAILGILALRTLR